MEFLKTQIVETEDEDVEVDVFSIAPSEQKSTKVVDPFSDIRKLDLLPQHLKRKATRLSKKVEADAGSKVGSKQVTGFPQITPYDVLQAAPPPHNLDYLAQLYEVSAPHNACFSYETKILTKYGARKIGDVSGTTVRLLTKNVNGQGKWVDAQISSFGKQSLFKITLIRQGSKKTIFATDNHRWFCVEYYGKLGRKKRFSEKITTSLAPGDKLRYCFPQKPNIELSPFGIAHGITFGDGTTHYNYEGYAAKLPLFGEKDAELLKWFPLSRSININTNSKELCTEIRDLPRFFKKLPDINEASTYLYGWLAGYFAADGSVDKRGVPALSSSTLDNLEFARDVATKLGIATTSIRKSSDSQHKIINEVKFISKSSYKLIFAVGELPEEFFLLSSHRLNFRKRTQRMTEWHIESVEKTNRFEEVYCAEVADTHSFVIEDFILTGNSVTMKSVNIAGLGYEWMQKTKITYELEDLRRKSQDAYEKAVSKLNKEKIELDEVLLNLNDEMEFNEVMMNVWTDVECVGNGYLEIGRNRNNKIAYIGHIPGQTMRVRVEKDGFIQIVSNKYVFFHNFGNQDEPNPLGTDIARGGDPRPNEIIHFKKYSPTSSYYGVPDIIAALSSTLGDKFAKEYNLDYFENKAVPRYALIVKGAKLSAKAEATLINYFQNELRGKHHGTLYIPVPASYGQNVDVEWKQLEVGIQDASFINYVREARQEILMVHRVPPNKLGIFANANLAISRDSDRTFKEQVCRPEQRRIEKKLQKLFQEFTDNFLFKFLEADVIDADIKSRIHDRYLRTRVLVPNDILRELGRPARPDGNEPLPYGKTDTPLDDSGKPIDPNSQGSKQRTSDGAKPTRGTPPDQTGQRQERGQAQDAGRQPNLK